MRVIVVEFVIIWGKLLSVRGETRFFSSLIPGFLSGLKSRYALAIKKLDIDLVRLSKAHSPLKDQSNVDQLTDDLSDSRLGSLQKVADELTGHSDKVTGSILPVVDD